MRKSFDGQSLQDLFFVLRPLAPLALGVYLWTLPSDYFDQGESVCMSVRLFDVECWGCGLTRRIHHLLHGQWKESLAYHPLGWLVSLLLGLVLLQWIRKAVYRWNKLRQGKAK